MRNTRGLVIVLALIVLMGGVGFVLPHQQRLRQISELRRENTELKAENKRYEAAWIEQQACRYVTPNKLWELPRREVTFSRYTTLTAEQTKGNSFTLTLATDYGEWTCVAYFYRGVPLPPGAKPPGDYLGDGAWVGQTLVMTPKREAD